MTGTCSRKSKRPPSWSPAPRARKSPPASPFQSRCALWLEYDRGCQRAPPASWTRSALIATPSVDQRADIDQLSPLRGEGLYQVATGIEGEAEISDSQVES